MLSFVARLAAAGWLVGEALAKPAHPHLVVFVADDLGYNDLGFTNGGKTHTPYINELVKESTILSNYYQWRLCSPSRASLLSGRYP